ncbi:MAG: hypothetical protein ACLQVD_13710 [Capsulimonadaceae bacterium]
MFVLKTYLSLFAAVSAILFCVCPAAHSQTDGSQPNAAANEAQLMTDLEGMAGLDGLHKQKLTDAAMAHYHDMVGTLINNLGSADQDTQFYSAAILGYMRADSAVYALAHMIGMKDPNYATRPQSHLWYWSEFPFAGALVEIGGIMPMLAVEHNLATSDDPKIRDLSIVVIDYIERDPGVAQAELKYAISKETDAGHKTTLEAALTQMQSDPTGVATSNAAKAMP